MNVESVIEIEKYVTIFLYIIVAILSIIRYPILRDSLLRFFPLLALLNLFFDVSGYFMSFLADNNEIIYNIYNLPYFVFIFALFREASSSRRTKKVMQVFQILIVIAIVVVSTQLDFLTIDQIPVVIFGNVLSIISILLYYIEILQTDRVILIKYDTLFWISVGFFLFFTGATTIEMIRTSFEYEYTLFVSLSAIQFTLIIIMNICFIVGLLVTKPKLS